MTKPRDVTPTRSEDVAAVRAALKKLPHETRSAVLAETIRGAAKSDPGIREMARALSHGIHRMGDAAALEVLAAIGWWWLENEGDSADPEMRSS